MTVSCSCVLFVIQLLPACSCSQALSTQTFQVMEEAAAVMSALHALHIPLALLVPAQSSTAVKECLEDTKMLDQFAAVVSMQLRVCCQAVRHNMLHVCAGAVCAQCMTLSVEPLTLHALFCLHVWQCAPQPPVEQGMLAHGWSRCGSSKLA